MVVDGAGFILNNRGSYFAWIRQTLMSSPQGNAPGRALSRRWPSRMETVFGLEHARRRHHSADTYSGLLECREFGMNVQQAAEAPCIVTSNSECRCTHRIRGRVGHAKDSGGPGRRRS